jgi:cytochrome c oxidase subunit 2
MVVLMGRVRPRLLACLVFGITTAGFPLPPPQPSTSGNVRVVEMTAERFRFTPSQVRVPAGTRLEIRLRSDDTIHGFHIVGTDIDIEIPKRGRGLATVIFEPAAGRYTFQCVRVCGAGHGFMRGEIIATE